MWKEKLKHDKRIIGLAALFVFVAIGWFFWDKSLRNSNMKPKTQVINAVFDCSDNKSFQAVFSGNIVDLTLFDGRKILLNQAMSADGARYTNKDKSFVFWNKGNTGFITEKGKTTFENCATK